MTIKEQVKLDDGHRFQKQLAEIIKEKRHEVIVETGTGVSSVYILKALDDAWIDGKLHSIDVGAWYPHKIEHPKFNPIKSKSTEALLPTYQNFGPFDIFCTDGSHNVLSQTYEYEIGLQFLKPGALLIGDDTRWSTHMAWHRFLERHNLKEVQMGDAFYVVKPLDMPYCPANEAVKAHEAALALAVKAEEIFLENGGENSDIFVD